MEAEQSLLNKFRYTPGEWATARLFTGLLWLLVMARVLLVSDYHGQPFPEGLCRLFDCSIMVERPIAYMVLGLAAVLVVLYILEKWMIPVLIGISLISVIILSVERSHGLNSRDELWSMVFIAQAIAHMRYAWSNEHFKKENNAGSIALFYCVQLIAAAYVISGLTKLTTAGFGWVTDSPNIILATEKIFQQLEIEFGIASNNVYHNGLVNLVQQYPNFIRFLFTGALCIELFAFTAMFSRQYARRYGILLLGLHIGIALLTAIVIPVFIFCIITYLTGWPNVLVRFFFKITTWLTEMAAGIFRTHDTM